MRGPLFLFLFLACAIPQAANAFCCCCWRQTEQHRWTAVSHSTSLSQKSDKECTARGSGGAACVRYHKLYEAPSAMDLHNDPSLKDAAMNKFYPRLAFTFVVGDPGSCNTNGCIAAAGKKLPPVGDAKQAPAAVAKFPAIASGPAVTPNNYKALGSAPVAPKATGGGGGMAQPVGAAPGPSAAIAPKANAGEARPPTAASAAGPPSSATPRQPLDVIRMVPDNEPEPPRVQNQLCCCCARAMRSTTNELDPHAFPVIELENRPRPVHLEGIESRYAVCEKDAGVRQACEMEAAMTVKPTLAMSWTMQHVGHSCKNADCASTFGMAAKQHVEDYGVAVEPLQAMGKSAQTMKKQADPKQAPEGQIKRLFIAGDLHGDFQTAKAMFDAAEFLDAKTGAFNPPKDAAFALLGDYFDRGKEDRQLFDFLYAARAKYPDHLYLLLGNHETMILAGDMKDSLSFPQTDLHTLGKAADNSDLAATEGWAARLDLHTCQGKLNQELRSLPVMLKLGTTLIAHAGPSLDWTRTLGKEVLLRFKDSHNTSPLTRAYNDMTSADLDRVCGRFTELMRTTPRADPGSLYGEYRALRGSRFRDSMDTCPDSSPVWYRGFSMAEKDDEKADDLCCSTLKAPECLFRPSGETESRCELTADRKRCTAKANAYSVCTALNGVLTRFAADRLVVAHSIQQNGVRQLCNGRLIMVDVQLSEPFRQKSQAHRRQRQHSEVLPDREFILLQAGSKPKRVFFALDSTKQPPLDNAAQEGSVPTIAPAASATTAAVPPAPASAAALPTPVDIFGEPVSTLGLVSCAATAQQFKAPAQWCTPAAAGK